MSTMPDMRGDLTDTSVADLCRGLAETEATGSVEIEADGGSGRIFFRRGRVYWAMSSAPRARLGDRLVNAALLTEEQLDQALTAQATSDDGTKLGAILVQQELVTRDVIRVFVQEQILDALFDLMRMSAGTFEFTSGDAAEEKLPVDIPVAQMLVEVSRRQSEWDQIQQAIPDLDHVPDFVTEGTSSSAASLEPDEFSVLANVDGARSIRELASDLGYSEFEAARIVYGLLLLGVISIRPPLGAGDEDVTDTEPAEATPEPVATDVEAEFDLGELEAPGEEAPAAPAAEDVAAADTNDIGRALDEAFGSGEPSDQPEPRSRPTVRVHVDDRGRFPEPFDEASTPPAESPEPAAAARPPLDPEELGKALAAALAEDEGDDGRDDEPAVAATAGTEEPEPWEGSDAPDYGFFAEPPSEDPGDEPDPAAPASDGATEDGPEARPDLPDEDFERLINELAGGAPGETSDQPHRSTGTDEEDDGDPRPRPDDGADDLPQPREGGDVSEFLRELSRLTVNDPDDEEGGSSASAERPIRRPEREDEDEGKDDRKRRGLFGWGR